MTSSLLHTGKRRERGIGEGEEGRREGEERGEALK